MEKSNKKCSMYFRCNWTLEDYVLYCKATHLNKDSVCLRCLSNKF